MINFLEYLYSPRGIYTTSLRVVSLHRRKHLFLSFPLEKYASRSNEAVEREGVRKGWGADIFSGSKVGPVAILPRVFFPKIYARPPLTTFNDVSCLLHAVIIAPPPLALSRLLSSKVIIADNRCLAFFRHPLIRKFLSPFLLNPPFPRDVRVSSSSPIFFPALKHANDIKNTNVLNLRSSPDR